MYHHVSADKLSNSAAILERHFEYVKEHFNIVLPGEALSEERTNICIVFDDASYSFYRYAFPLIKKIGIRLILAVSPKFILDSAGQVSAERRLSVPVDEMMQGNVYATAIPFCSWQELSEISSSGLVSIASHSFSHCNLLQSSNVEDELMQSKEILHKKMRQEIDSFVYPYGQFNASIVKHAQKHYRYHFAVGAGDNKTWKGVGSMLFRMYADDLPDPISIFSPANLRKYRLLRPKLFLKKWLMDRKTSL